MIELTLGEIEVLAEAIAQDLLDDEDLRLNVAREQAMGWTRREFDERFRYVERARYYTKEE